jgi:hypothetical protein
MSVADPMAGNKINKKICLQTGLGFVSMKMMMKKAAVSRRKLKK